MRSAEEFCRQVREKGISEWMVYRCSICEEPCGFVFENGKVYYDSNCDCSGMSYVQSSTWDDVAEYYNSQTEADTVADMDRFWGFSEQEIPPKSGGSVFTWYGKPESELSREELLDIIEHLYKENESLRAENSRQSIDFIKHLASQAKKGLRI